MQRPRLSLLKLGAVLMVVLAAALLIATHFNFAGAVHRCVEALRGAGPLAFFAAMALLPAFGFPLAALTVVAAPVFGPTMGLVPVIACTVAAVAVNVALSYWLAARALRPLVGRLLRWLGCRLPEITPASAWPVVLIVRIIPGPPFFVQSYLLGLARAPFGIYMIVSTIVPAGYLAGTIVLTDGIAHHDRREMGAAILIFLTAGAIIHYLRKRVAPPHAASQSAAPR